MEPTPPAPARAATPDRPAMLLPRRALLASLFSLPALATAAMAADMPLRGALAAPEAVETPAHDWTGGSLGLQGGWGVGGDKVGFGSPTPLAPSSRDIGELGLRGGFVGLRAGYDVQSPFSPWVAGVAVEASLGEMRRSFDAAAPVVATGAARLDWDAAARLRVGYAMDRLLLYVTGGVALAQEKYRVSVRAPVLAELRGTKTFLGATFGLGAEYALTRSLAVGLEYRATLFGSKTIAGPVTAAGVPLGSAQTRASPNFHRLAASVNWRF
jgi:outer membrane immunogenic protein